MSTPRNLNFHAVTPVGPTVRIDTDEIAYNPENPRDMTLTGFQEGVATLAVSIMSAGYLGDPIVVVEIDERIAERFFGGTIPDNGQEPFKYMLISGHRRTEAMKRAHMLHNEKLGKSKRKDITEEERNIYKKINATIVSSEQVSSLMLNALIANTNREDADVISKAKGVRALRRLRALDEIAEISAKVRMAPEKRAEAIRAVEEDPESVITDNQMAQALGISPAHVARYRKVLTYGEKIQRLFATGVAKEANISDVSAALNDKLTEDEIYTVITSDKRGTYDSINKALSAARTAKKKGTEQSANGASAANTPNPDTRNGLATIFAAEIGVDVSNVRVLPGEAGYSLNGTAAMSYIAAMLSDVKMSRASRDNVAAILEVCLPGAQITLSRDAIVAFRKIRNE